MASPALVKRVEASNAAAAHVVAFFRELEKIEGAYASALHKLGSQYAELISGNSEVIPGFESLVHEIAAIGKTRGQLKDQYDEEVIRPIEAVLEESKGVAAAIKRADSVIAACMTYRDAEAAKLEVLRTSLQKYNVIQGILIEIAGENNRSEGVQLEDYDLDGYLNSVIQVEMSAAPQPESPKKKSLGSRRGTLQVRFRDEVDVIGFSDTESKMPEVWVAGDEEGAAMLAEIAAIRGGGSAPRTAAPHASSGREEGAGDESEEEAEAPSAPAPKPAQVPAPAAAPAAASSAAPAPTRAATAPTAAQVPPPIAAAPKPGIAAAASVFGGVTLRATGVDTGAVRPTAAAPASAPAPAARGIPPPIAGSAPAVTARPPPPIARTAAIPPPISDRPVPPPPAGVRPVPPPAGARGPPPTSHLSVPKPLPSAAAAAVGAPIQIKPVAAKPLEVVAQLTPIITETINCQFGGGQLRRCDVSGQISFAGTVKEGSSLDRFLIGIEGRGNMDELLPNRAFIQAAEAAGRPDGSTFVCMLQPLRTMLQQREVAAALKYRLSPGKIANKIPLIISIAWKTEPTLTSVIITYKGVSDRPIKLSSLVFEVKVSGGVTGMQAKPDATWHADESACRWALGDLELRPGAEVSGKLLGRYAVTSPSVAAPVSVSFAIEGTLLSDVTVVNLDHSGVTQVGQPSFRVAAGKYFAA